MPETTSPGDLLRYRIPSQSAPGKPHAAGAPVARSRICHELSFLDVELLEEQNAIDGPLISRLETESTFA
jgi:hypothetical protein